MFVIKVVFRYLFKVLHLLIESIKDFSMIFDLHESFGSYNVFHQTLSPKLNQTSKQKQNIAEGAK